MQANQRRAFTPGRQAGLEISPPFLDKI